MERCLIVDDNRGFLAAARALLEREGVPIVGVAETSAEALAQTAALRPDAVLVDVSLGKESGFDLAQRLADADGAHRAAVILISTRGEDELVDLLAESPAIGFLSKASLSATAVQRLLSERRGT
jgi:DNA-binding NarL/FixJ family response regulator